MLKRKIASPLFIIALAVVLCISMLGLQSSSYAAGPKDEQSGKELKMTTVASWYDQYGLDANNNEGFVISKLTRTISAFKVAAPGLVSVSTSAKDASGSYLRNSDVAVYKDAACTDRIYAQPDEYIDDIEMLGNGSYYFDKAGTYYLAYNNSADNISGTINLTLIFFKTVGNLTYTGTGKVGESVEKSLPGTINAAPVTMKFVPKVTGVYYVGNDAQIKNSSKKVISSTKYGTMQFFGLKKGATYYVYYPVNSGAAIRGDFFMAIREYNCSKTSTSLSGAKKLTAVTVKGAGSGYESQRIMIQMIIGSKSSSWMKIKVSNKKSYTFSQENQFNGKYSAAVYSSGGSKLFSIPAKGVSKTLNKGTYYIKCSRSSAAYSGMAGINID